MENLYLSDIVKRNEIFQRSINIALDDINADIIDNFYCPISYEDIIVGMINNITQTKQSSFTWTGTYGSGKSSLALFLQALIHDDNNVVQSAQDKLSQTHKKIIIDFFNPKHKWKVINLVGKNIKPEDLLKEFLFHNTNISNDELLKKIEILIAGDNRLIIFIDELGKTLETINKNNQIEDIYFLQQLAELSNRSQGKLIFIGILHQSFNAYTRQSKKQVYNEWQKIQGRFIDCAITLSVDEQIYLLSKVIGVSDEYKHVINKDYYNQVWALINNIAKNKHIDKQSFFNILKNVFPLNPFVAVLLCQLSKKEFGQNQRSIFSFLMSAEPYGFSNYLKNNPIDEFEVYSFNDFWNYIDTNLGNLILSSDNAKLWMLSREAVSRYEAVQDASCVSIIKIISLATLLDYDTGIHISIDLLCTLLNAGKNSIGQVLNQLESSGLIYYSKLKQSFVLNEGSNFNLAKTIKEYLPYDDENIFDNIKDFEPIIAKRHYQQTGSLRWAQVKLITVSISDIDDIISSLAKSTDASLVGFFCLLISTDESEYTALENRIKNLVKSHRNIAISLLEDKNQIIDLLREKSAVKDIIINEQRLINDNIARQETEFYLTLLEDKIDFYLNKFMNSSIWHCHLLKESPKILNTFQIAALTSNIADYQISQSVICNNELVNRDYPSPNAKGAIRELMKRMVENGKYKDLGINNYPPERAIYDSILLKNNIHISDDGINYYFTKPGINSSLYPIWKIADDIIRNKKGGLVTADEIYQVWQAPPYGIKKGLCDILYIAYIISRNTDLASYINNEYKPNLQYLLVEYLLKSPASIGVREVSELKEKQPWIYILKDKLTESFSHLITNPIDNEPLPIAQALISVYDKLPSWLNRTNELSPATKQLRNILKQANDPNKLLFDELPKFFTLADSDENKATIIVHSLQDMHKKFPDLVNELNAKLADKLKIDKFDDPYTKIHNRANILWKKTGNPELESFIARLRTYQGTPKEAEGLIGLLAGNKPPKNWIDQDIQKALQQLTKLCYEFLEAEITTDTNGMPDRYQVSVILKSPNIVDSIGDNAQITPDTATKIQKMADDILSESNFRSFTHNDKIAVISEVLSQILKSSYRDMHNEKHNHD